MNDSWITVKDVVIIVLGAAATALSSFAIKVLWSWNDSWKKERAAVTRLEKQHVRLRGSHVQLKHDVEGLEQEHDKLSETVTSHGVRLAVIEDRVPKPRAGGA